MDVIRRWVIMRVILVRFNDVKLCSGEAWSTQQAGSGTGGGGWLSVTADGAGHVTNHSRSHLLPF